MPVPVRRMLSFPRANGENARFDRANVFRPFPFYTKRPRSHHSVLIASRQVRFRRFVVDVTRRHPKVCLSRLDAFKSRDTLGHAFVQELLDRQQALCLESRGARFPETTSFFRLIREPRFKNSPSVRSKGDRVGYCFHTSEIIDTRAC